MRIVIPILIQTGVVVAWAAPAGLEVPDKSTHEFLTLDG